MSRKVFTGSRLVLEVDRGQEINGLTVYLIDTYWVVAGYFVYKSVKLRNAMANPVSL